MYYITGLPIYSHDILWKSSLVLNILQLFRVRVRGRLRIYLCAMCKTKWQFNENSASACDN